LDSREHKVTEAIKYKEVTTVTPQKHTKEEKKKKKKKKKEKKVIMIIKKPSPTLSFVCVNSTQ
jgi:hypothetical protein